MLFIKYYFRSCLALSVGTIGICISVNIFHSVNVQNARLLKSLLQHHSSRASILLCSAFFTVQLSHPYMTTGKTIVLTRWTLVGKVMSLLFNMLPRLVITFLPRSKCLLISWEIDGETVETVSDFIFGGAPKSLRW